MNTRIEEDAVRMERERYVAVTALRHIRDNSISHDDAIHMAVEALRHCGVVPQPTFEDHITAFLAEHRARLAPSLGEGLERLAAGEAVTQRMLTEAPTEERCASCERQDSTHGPAGLCDGCLEALEDSAA